MASVACAQRESKGVSGTAVYQRRQPERSVVYQVIQGHLETWLAGCRAVDDAGFPVAGYIEQDFRKYLECGILAHGFARARCAGCGYDFLIAYGCDTSCIAHFVQPSSAQICSRQICPVKGVVFVPPAIRGAWWKRQHTWSMRSFRKSPCTSGA